MIIRSTLIVLTICIFSCVSDINGPPYTTNLAPLSKIPGLGSSLVIPNEDGWILFDPDGKGSFITKFGQTEIESYVISLDRYNHAVPNSSDEFRKLYEILKQREISVPRYKLLLVKESARASLSTYALDFYYLVEDHQPIELPNGDEYMLLETMGFFALHPYIPDTLIRVAYSYRYAKGHEDSLFAEKAKWVLGNVVFTGN